MESREDQPACPSQTDVSPWLWLGLPAASLLVVLLTPLLGYQAWNRYFMMGDNWHTKEFGFLEVAPLFFLAAAVVLAIILFLRRRHLPRRVGAFMLLVGVAAFYFMGEESSWGQHYIGYGTPESLRALNRQHEFNLHNNKGVWKTFFSTIPRTGATVVLSAAAIAPLLLARKRRDANWTAGPWHWLLPTPAMTPVCAMAVLATVPAHLLKSMGYKLASTGYAYMALDKPSGELKEYLIALAILIYLASVLTRLSAALRRPSAAGEAAAPHTARQAPQTQSPPPSASMRSSSPASSDRAPAP